MATNPRPFSAGELEAICKALADTVTGLTGTEISHALRQVRVTDPDPAETKWRQDFPPQVCGEDPCKWCVQDPCS
jgi:hypothetical protein